MPILNLPDADGTMRAHTMRDPVPLAPAVTPFNRIVYSAAHVVADPYADIDPWLGVTLDFDATLAYRRHLLSLGFGIAEAMDTAQRGMGLGWPEAQTLIRASLEATRDIPGALIACGCGTDHLDPASARGLDDVIRAYEQQIEFIENLGGSIILMASRALAACAESPDDYLRVYSRLLEQVRQPVILHWLGEMFDPALAGYWGHADHAAAMDTCLDVIAAAPDKVDGIKVSLLDKDKEIAMRRRLPPGVRMYTGDDFNYPELIDGDEQGYSHALLGIFDTIAPVAATALSALTQGDRTGYHALLEPTVPLSRHIFKAPTRFYKTGVVFMAYLNGHQDHFLMVGGQQSARSLLHFSELFRLADAAGLFHDPDDAAARMRRYLAVSGVPEA